MKKMTPLMLATMMLAPGILIEEACAQRNTNPSNRRPAPSTGELNVGERLNLLQERDFGNWDRGYLGKRSFKLNDDSEFARVSARAAKEGKELKAVIATLANKEKAFTEAQKKVNAINSDIAKISQAIVKALSDKTKKEGELPGLRRNLNEKKKQKEVAQAALDSTKQSLDQANAQVEAKKTNLEKAKTECAEDQSEACKKKVTRATNQLKKSQAAQRRAKSLFDVADGNMKKAKNELADSDKKLKDTQKAIQTITAQNTQRSKTLDAKKSALQGEEAKVAVAKRQMLGAQKIYKAKVKATNDAVAQKNRVANILISDIMRLNKRGALVGEEAGSVDGDIYAERLGVGNGLRDGDRDGTEAGTVAGQRASYERGSAQGEIEGRQEADLQGQRDGTALGTQQANVEVASERGSVDGRAQARSSDAEQVGQAQGRDAGLARAVKEGEIAGVAQGEKQAIAIHETQNLNNSNIDGAFKGAFAAIVPSYPGFDCITVGSRRYYRDDFGWRRGRYVIDNQMCPNFRPSRHSEYARTNRPILKEAFMDGYLRGYRTSRRGQFVQSIDNYYLSSYENSRSAAFAEFSSRDYPRDREQGRSEGHRAAFDTRYPLVKEDYRVQAYERTLINPDVDSADYTNTYASVRQSTYNRVYEQIRVANYNQLEGQTFAANIEEQTEIFRKKRYAQVDAVYKNNPVVKFVSSQVTDGGIQGIAKNDGIYQPGETTLHSVTLINYGDKSADAVVAINENGDKVKLPSIPAKSKVEIKGAFTGSISTGAKIGSRYQTNLKVTSPLTAEAKIQGRHYSVASRGEVISSDKKTLSVQYPLSLSGLGTSSELLINQANSLKVTAANNSKRKYTGPLKVELSVDSQTGIVTSDFNDLSELSGSKTINTAKILVASERDVYTPLNFTAKITKSGVTLGVLNSSYTTMAKAPYKKKAGKPVFVVDSSKNAGDLVNALKKVGGLSNASVVDLSLARLNRNVLAEGLNKQMTVVLDDLRGSTVKGVAALLKNAEDTVMLFVDHRNQGINTALRSNVMKNAVTLPVHLKGNNELFNLRFTNPFLDGVDEMTVVAQTTPNGMVDAIKTLSGFMKTNNELVAQAGSALNAKNYLQQSAPLQNMIAMATAEILTINRAYKVTNNSNYEKLVIDSKRIYGRILDQSGKKVSNKSLSKNLAAMNMYYVIDRALDHFDPVDDRMDQDIELKVEDRMRDIIKGTGLFRLGRGLRENLKRHSESMYNRMDDNKYVQSPFKL
ncbi:MAG: hypothetical protein ACN6I0_00375 [Peredibacter sp.]